MNSIGEYLAKFKILDREGFLQRYSDPVLIWQNEPQVSSSAGFNTSTITRPTMRDLINRLNPRCRIFCIAKTPTNPYPEMVFVGRAANNDIVIPHRTISKVHAYFLMSSKDGACKLVEKGSKNGTKLNGVRLVSGKQYNLNDSDQIIFGDCAMLFHTSSGFHGILSKLQ